MSERAAAFGALAPPKTIEHNGRVYTIAPVMTHGVMMAVENKLYERAKQALRAVKDELSAEQYAKELAELRKRHEEGYYAFESEHTLKALETTRGALLLLSCMMDADEGEILELLTTKTEELEGVLNEALEASFPPDKRPKAKAPRSRGANGKRHRAGR